jgi:hypothetical protein
MTLAYFTTCTKENENLPLIWDAINWLHLWYNLAVKIVQLDGEMNRNRTKAWLTSRGIDFEKCAPDTHEQNGVAERMGRLIVEKARAMRLSALLPHALWREIIATAVYLYNRTPKHNLEWKSPYEAFHDVTMLAEQITSPRKPTLHHLKSYECWSYVLIKSARDPDKPKKWQKLRPKAHISFLVGYKSTNIYRIWIPHKKKVISARDVLFDKEEFYDGKPIRFSDILINKLDEAIEEVSITPDPNLEDIQLREDESEPEIIEDFEGVNKIEEVEEGQPETHEESELVETDKVTGAYPTPDPTVDSSFLAWLDETLPVRSEGVKAAVHLAILPDKIDPDLPDIPDYEPAILDEIRHQREDQFSDFHQHRIPQTWHIAFQTGSAHRRDAPLAPKNYRELTGHTYKARFKESMQEQIDEHVKIVKSWTEIHKSEAKEYQILGCQWVFKYKTDKHRRITKCKARIIVCGNQQRECDLPTRATTLATTSFRVLLATAAKFDLETLQLDPLNTFVHAEIDETVYMRMPPGFQKLNTVVQLNKALYGLRRSPILWQTKFTGVLRNMGFAEVPQELCIMKRGGIIYFFYVDDIVFAYRKKDAGSVTEAVTEIWKHFKLKTIGELKWFLGIHIFRDRPKRSLWLSQQSYIKKLANEFILGNKSDKGPPTPMAEEELPPLPTEVEVLEADRTLYQRKISSILYAAISTRPDIAFAAARLSRYNCWPGKIHQDAANRVVQYLYRTRFQCIRFGHESSATSFVCTSDASFADNTLDRKSSQGYVLKLFGGPVAWRANKQDTVTTSSTEAKLLALSQTAKELIYLSHLLKALSLELDEPLAIECDNRQTIRLLAESAKLQTKLRHVDIHSHWLCQEV